jgi:hypothetical protein
MSSHLSQKSVKIFRRVHTAAQLKTDSLPARNYNADIIKVAADFVDR